MYLLVFIKLFASFKAVGFIDVAFKQMVVKLYDQLIVTQRQLALLVFKVKWQKVDHQALLIERGNNHHHNNHNLANKFNCI